MIFRNVCFDFSQPLTGIILSENTGTVRFNEGDAYRVKMVDIQGDGFLELGTTFTVSLQGVQYLGNGGMFIVIVLTLIK